MLRENSAMSRKRILLALYLVALGFTVFTPKTVAFADHKSGVFYLISSFFQPFHNNSFTPKIGNFLLLAPLGILLLLQTNLNLTKITLICFATTVGIESIQNFIPSRVPDIPTILINGIGGSVTTILFSRLRPNSSRKKV